MGFFDTDEDIEKGYSKTVTVPAVNGRKGYQYIRNYDGIEGKQNKIKQPNVSDGVQTEFKNRIDAPEIKNLAVCSDADFARYVDDLFNGNYKNLPSVIRMPDLNGKLTQKLHLANVHCYMLKNRFTHINPIRKGRYNQDFRIEEYKEIPRIIRNARIALYDIQKKNFALAAYDKKDKNKVNTITFNKDINGNYLVTIGKKDRLSFGSGEYKIIGGGS